MGSVTYLKISKENFNKNSLDTFVRHQQVKECWRNIDGQWKIVPVEFVEDWDIDNLRDKAVLMQKK